MRSIAKMLPYPFGNGLTVGVLQAGEIEEAAQLVADTALVGEPMTWYLKLLRKPLLEATIWFLRRCSNPMLSIVAKDQKKTIIGTFLAGEVDFGPTKYAPEEEEDYRIVRIIRDAESICRDYYTREGLHGKLMSGLFGGVDSQYRGQNTFQHMLHATCINGKQHVFSHMMGETTNYFASVPIDRLGATCVGKIYYDDWVLKGPNGDSRPFQGLNEEFTKRINNRRVGKKPLTDLAKYLNVYDFDFERILALHEKLNI